MLFIEILYLIDIKEHPADAIERCALLKCVMHVGKRRHGRVQPHEMLSRHSSDDIGDSRLSRARRSVKHDARQMSAFDHTAKRSTRTDEVLLPHYLIKIFRS